MCSQGRGTHGQLSARAVAVAAPSRVFERLYRSFEDQRRLRMDRRFSLPARPRQARRPTASHRRRPARRGTHGALRRHRAQTAGSGSRSARCGRGSGNAFGSATTISGCRVWRERRGDSTLADCSSLESRCSGSSLRFDGGSRMIPTRHSTWSITCCWGKECGPVQPA